MYAKAGQNGKFQCVSNVLLPSVFNKFTAGTVRDKMPPMGATGDRLDSAAEPSAGLMEAVLNSQTFQKAPALRHLLQYLWEHRTEEVNEYSIAVDAFSRRADFDPKIDATVRVQIARLRQKLKEYYDSEGSGSAQMLTVPLGKHRIEIVSGPALVYNELRTRNLRLRKAILLLASVVILLAAACTVLVVQNHRVTASVSESRPALPAFWTQLVGNGINTRLVLETPVFFRWEESNLKVRDVRVNEFADYPQSEELGRLVKRFGAPKLMQNYTATSDTFAAIRLLQFLESRGCHLSVVSGADLSMDAAEESNLILIGTAGVNRRFRGLLEKANFVPVPDGDRVVNRSPKPGERPEYVQVLESPKRRTVPGVVGVLPVGTRRNRALIMIGVEPVALANYLTSPSGLAALDKARKEQGSPEFFDAVVEAEVHAGTVLKANLVAFRAHPVSR
jgi:hypothetical protein